jgi:hypothetical protein
MAVVINEFEVVPAAPAGHAPPKPADKKEKPKPDPDEVLRLIRQHAARAARVRAH